MADDKKDTKTTTPPAAGAKPAAAPAAAKPTPAAAGVKAAAASANGAPTAKDSALKEQAEKDAATEDAKKDQAKAAGADEKPADSEGGPEEKPADSEEGKDGEEGDDKPVMTIYDMNAAPSAHGKDFFVADSEKGQAQEEEEDNRTREDDGQVLYGKETGDSGLPIDTGSALIESGLDLGEPADELAEQISDLKLSGDEGAREDAKALSPDKSNANTGPGTGDVTVSTMDNGEEGGKRIQDPEGTGKEQVLMSDTPEHRVANVPMGVEPFSDYMSTPHKVQTNGPADRPEPNRREDQHDFPGNRAQKGREENKAKKDK